MIRMPLRCLIVATAVLLSATALHAMPQWENKDKPKTARDLVKLKASADAYRVGPGEEFMLLFEFTIEPEWHIYWKNPGETGAPTQFEVEAPPSYTVGEPIFARPERIEAETGVTYGYEKRAVVAIPIKAPEGIAEGTVTINTSINYLVCKSICLMGDANTSMTIHTSPTTTGHKASLDTTGAKLEVSFPKPIKDVEHASASFDGTKLTIVAPAEGTDEATFFPLELPGVTYGKAQLDRKDGALHMIVPVEINEGNALGQEMRVAGLVALGSDQKDPCFEFDLPVAVSKAQAE